jgi:hypothetical protein
VEIQHQPQSNSATFWTPSPWKASPYLAALRKVSTISPYHCCLLQTCLCVNVQNEQVSTMHHAGLSYPPLGT